MFENIKISDLTLQVKHLDTSDTSNIFFLIFFFQLYNMQIKKKNLSVPDKALANISVKQVLQDTPVAHQSWRKPPARFLLAVHLCRVHLHLSKIK